MVMELKGQFTGREVTVEVNGIRGCIKTNVVRCVCDGNTRVEFKLSEDRCYYTAYFYVCGKDNLALRTKVSVEKDISDVLKEYSNAIRNGHRIYDIQIRTVHVTERAIEDAHKYNMETLGVNYHLSDTLIKKENNKV